MAKGARGLTFFINCAMTATIIGMATGIGVNYILNEAVSGFVDAREVPEDEAIVLLGQTMPFAGLVYKMCVFGGVGLFIGLGYAFTVAARTKKPKNFEKDVEAKMQQLIAEKQAAESAARHDSDG